MKTAKYVRLNKYESCLHKKLVTIQIKLNKCQRSKQQCMKILKAIHKTIIFDDSFTKVLENVSSSAKILSLLKIRDKSKKLNLHYFKIEEKLNALRIYLQNPIGYKFLSKIFVLPSSCVVNKLISEANIKPGINKDIFCKLRKRAAKMILHEKLCVLMFGEMTIKRNITYNDQKDCVIGLIKNDVKNSKGFADRCLVFMIRGLKKGYGQPLYYSFSSGPTEGPELSSQIKQIIRELFDVGLIPIATVCKPGKNNERAIKILIEETRAELSTKGEILKNNIFKVHNKQIIPLFDPPHLLIGMRDNLINKNLVYLKNGEECVAKWDHIKMLYMENLSYREHSLIPKITENHVIPSKIDKSKFIFATQIFSSSVSVCMGYVASEEVGILPKECQETAKILMLFDKLFDSLNGSLAQREKSYYEKPLLRAVTPTSRHYLLWKEAKILLSGMKFVNKTKQVKNVSLMRNWISTIEGIELLTRILLNKYGITSVYMRNLNQDPLENFFAQIRYVCGNIYPTANRFSIAFTSLLIKNANKTKSPENNFATENCKNLIFLKFNKKIPSPYATEINRKHLNIDYTLADAEKQSPPVNSSSNYVAGYLYKKAQQKIYKSCRKCNEVMTSKTQCKYISFRRYGKRWFCYPSVELVEIVSKLQAICRTVLFDEIHNE
ncbi:unnamed protein product, partial [Parnassius mnemosyne]